MDTGTDYFTLLGLDVDDEVDEATLKAAYRKAAREAHPDAGGSDERFRAVQDAYETLRDPDRARLYRAELALREIRGRMARGYVPAGDYVPYVLSQIDPTGRHAAEASRPSTASGPEPSDDAADAEAGAAAGPSTAGPTAAGRHTAHADASWWELRLLDAFAQRERPWDGNDFDTEARSRWNAWRRARERVQEGIRSEMGRRLRRLATVPLWQRAVGALVGGLLATLALMLAAGPHTSTHMTGWQFLGAVLGWQLARHLMVTRRSYRVDDRALVGIGGVAAVGGVAVASMLGGWVFLVAAAAVTAVTWRWWVWFRQRGQRHLDSPTARDLGVSFDRTGDSPRVVLDDDIVAALVDEAVAHEQATVSR